MRIDTTSTPQLKTEAGSPSAVLDSLSAGDTVSAQVASVIGDRLVLRFPGGTAAAVTQRDAPALSPGDTLELLIKEKSGGQTFVEITGVTPAGKGGDLAALLRSLGLSADEAQLTVAREFLNQGLMLTSEGVSNAAGLLTVFNALTAGQAVFMVSNDLPANDHAAFQLSALLEHRSALGGKLLELLSLLDDGGGQSAASGEAGAAVPEAGGRTDAPQNAQPPVTQGPQSHTGTGTPGLPESEQAGTSASPPSHGATDAPQSSPSGTRTSSEGEVTPPARPGAEPAASAAQPQDAASERAKASPPVPAAVTEEGLSPSRTSPEGGPPSLQPGGQGGQAVPEPALPPAGGRPSVSGGGTAARPDGGVHLPHPPGTAAGDGAARLVPGNTDASVGQGGQSQVAGAESVKARLLSLFRRIGGDERNLPRSLDARRVVEELSETFAALREHARSLPPERQAAVLSAVKETEQSLSFLHNLGQFGRLVQIPVQLGDFRTTAELCVFRDGKGGKRIDPRNATLFLSLGTANMGRVEAFVRVVGRNVECDFSLPDEKALRMMRQNAAPLYSMLEADGYRLTRASFTLEERPAGLVAAGGKKREADRRFRIDLKI